MMNRRNAELRRKNRIGAAMLAATVLGFAGLLYGAARIDAANGITVSESLANNGIHGAAAFARAVERERPAPFRDKLAAAIGEEPAVEARLIGYCGGRILAAGEESSFPANCDWIEQPAGAAPRLAVLGAADHVER